MNLSRLITGLFFIILGVTLIVLGLFFIAPFIWGIIFLILGIVILLNSKEDEIEQIKYSGRNTRKGTRK